ncbi:MAG TPA: metalloregulator ArsR/SmtB family transcription factor [Marinagarivorans sp.]
MQATRAHSNNCAAPSTTSDLTALFKAAGDDLRLGVLQVLAQDSYGVLELAHVFGVKQSGISHHLKVLANAGLVTTRREGNSIFYRRAHIAAGDPQANAKHAIFTQVDALPASSQIERALAAVWQERTQTSHQFFIENADKFKAQQDLIASFDVYGAQVAEVLALSPLQNKRRALEVGPGEGEFLKTLSTHFDNVVALDNSPYMLANAKAHTHGEDNIEFILGDTRELSQQGPFDCAVINMVLHHTPSPAQVLADVSQVLATNGVLLIAELCSHQQVWARDTCGDVWLGFEPDDLKGWAEAVDLQQGHSTYFALRNGFQIQIQQFIKRRH